MTPTAAATARPDLQELALEAWEPTKTTLHLGPDRRQGPLRWYCGKQSPVHLFWHGFDLASLASPAAAPRPATAPTRHS